MIAANGTWPTRCGRGPGGRSRPPATRTSLRGHRRPAARAARAQLRALELRLKPDHPDIGRAKSVIAELERKAEAEAWHNRCRRRTPPPIVNIDRAALARVETMRVEILELRQRLESGKREAARFRSGAGSTRRASRPLRRSSHS